MDASYRSVEIFQLRSLMFLFSVFASWVVLLAAVGRTKASALTTTIAPNERLCFFADVDKAGEKIGVWKMTYWTCIRR